MSVCASLKRIESLITEARQRKVKLVTVECRDLAELMWHFKLMDAQDRLHYPQHVEMMADAAQKALAHLPGAYAVDIMQALDLSRPGWRDKN